MKKVLKNSNTIEAAVNASYVYDVESTKAENFRDFDTYMVIKSRHSGARYHVHEGDVMHPMKMRLQVTKLTPYDDQEYYWADIKNGKLRYIYKGKIEQSLQLMFDPEEDEELEFLDDLLAEIVVDLDDYNKSIKPNMMHN